MRGKELIEALKSLEEYDPEVFSQTLTLENEDGEEVEYTIQQGVDFIEVLNDEGDVVAKDVPPEDAI